MHFTLSYLPGALDVLKKVEEIFGSLGVIPSVAQDECCDEGIYFSHKASRKDLVLEWVLSITPKTAEDDRHTILLHVSLKRDTLVEYQLCGFLTDGEWQIEHINNSLRDRSRDEQELAILLTPPIDESGAFKIIFQMGMIFGNTEIGN